MYAYFRDVIISFSQQQLAVSDFFFQLYKVILGASAVQTGTFNQ